MNKIIKSLLDTDAYKFFMMQAVFHKYTNVQVKYELKWRNWDKMSLNISLKDFLGRVKEQLDVLCELRFTQEELSWLSTCSYFTKDFIEYLKLFQFNRSYIHSSIKNEQLSIVINGPWLNTILFEVPVLAIISEIYTEHNGSSEIVRLTQARKNLDNKLKYIYNNVHKDSTFTYGDFGTRRRASRKWHEETIDTQIKDIYGYSRFVGTSNMWLAMKYGIKFLGTQAHEWYQAHQQLGSRLVDSQKTALQVWCEEYRGDLGIALSDCLTFDFFLADFDKYFAKLFDGCRHDSGDPRIWCNKLINHYRKLNIDSKTKTALFSDGLNIPLAIELYNEFSPYIKIAFGIGTNLTNDVGFLAPQIVIKMVECNNRPVAKISDSSGKGMCEDEGYLTYLKSIIAQKTGNKLV